MAPLLLIEVLLHEGTRDEIENFLSHLTANDVYDEEEGCHYWDIGGEKIESSVCTNGAKLVVDKFGGDVFGYHFDGDSSGKVGSDAGGHDFAIVQDRYLVDWWGANVEGTSKAIYDLSHPKDAEEVERLYAPRDQWVKV
jgi:hypothetical protein